MKLSIVIPAYNEASLIAATLSNMLADSTLYNCTIIVVCNGCVDNSLSVLKAFELENTQLLTSRHIVLLIEDEKQASKTHALNVGLKAVSGDVVILLDADIKVEGETLVKLAKSLLDNKLKAMSPKVYFNTENSSFWVRQYYNVAKNSYYNQSLRLSNVIALTSQGVTEIAPFPELIADDEYIRRTLAPSDYGIDQQTSFSFIAPQNLSSVIAVLSRVERGNMQLAEMGILNVSNTFGQSVANSSVLAKGVFIVTKLCAKIRARYEFYFGAKHKWHRDQSTRKRL